MKRKKKADNKMKIFMYCRVGNPDQILSEHKKDTPVIVQRDKKVLIS